MYKIDIELDSLAKVMAAEAVGGMQDSDMAVIFDTHCRAVGHVSEEIEGIANCAESLNIAGGRRSFIDGLVAILNMRLTRTSQRLQRLSQHKRTKAAARQQALRESVASHSLAGTAWGEMVPDAMVYAEMPRETMNVRRLENTMNEIVGLSRLFAAKTALQAEQINLIYDSALVTLDNVDRGNRSLWSAKRHLTAGTRLMVVYLLAATTCLWLLHLVD